MTTSPPLLILGVGYVGRRLLARHPQAVGTHRPGGALGPRELPFSLEARDTWRNLPTSGGDVVWTFPARPLDSVEAFHEERLRDARSLIVLGSTSAYLVSSPDQLVDEGAPLDLGQERVAGEEWLRERGATVLQLAGIHGPGREPIDWLRKGLIRNGGKRVNLIHVDDIASLIDHLLESPQPGLRLNVSDGRGPTWDELVAGYRSRGELPGDFALAHAPVGPESKRVDNARLRALLPPGYAFRAP